ncbi:hypothetical protein [Corynebacterium auriscanis]|uniref:hypothetical protein n=1 Tax=Corynebacterium auriscanis TaxID=99807 RepID=UPI003CEF954E
MPAQHVVESRCDEQIAGGGVGRVDKDLVVHAVGVKVAGDVNEPQCVEAALKGAPIASLIGAYFCKETLSDGVAMDRLS